MGILEIFKKPIFTKSVKNWQEFGRYNAQFTAFGADSWQSDIVRYCIRPLASFTSKANCRSSATDIERLLNGKPNMYMTGSEFLQKCRIRYELTNTCLIYIGRDDRLKITSYYPIPYRSFKALEYANGLFLQFTFKNGQSLTLPWEDIAAVRKDYNESDIAGDPNTAILRTLELIETTNQGVSNAVKATANLRGILKSTKGMLSPEDVKKQKDLFVNDYLNLENEGGIACLDSTLEFTPISMNPTVATYAQMKEFRENVMRYYGVNDNVVMGKMTADEIEAFYEIAIEPFLVALSQALTVKSFSSREIGFNNYIVYESNRLQFASVSSKLAMVQLVDRAVMTPNELRQAFNLAPYDGGDEFIRRLDTMPINEESEE